MLGIPNISHGVLRLLIVDRIKGLLPFSKEIVFQGESGLKMSETIHRDGSTFHDDSGAAHDSMTPSSTNASRHTSSVSLGLTDHLQVDMLGSDERGRGEPRP